MALRTGTAPVVVGTQALLSEGVGVRPSSGWWSSTSSTASAWSSARRSPSGPRPRPASGAAHLLYMTATPIPRTLALTAYGDLTVSTIRTRPPGRVAGRDALDPRAEDREAAYEEVRAELRAGRQAYVICPLVEEGAAAEARAATTEAERLRDGPVRGLHGRASPTAPSAPRRSAPPCRLRRGPHRPAGRDDRGRGGHRRPQRHGDRDRGRRPLRPGPAPPAARAGRARGATRASACCSASPSTEDGARRLEALTQTTDGFRLAELDLEIRGEREHPGPPPGRARPTCASPAWPATAASWPRRATWRGGCCATTRAWSAPSTACCATPCATASPRSRGCWTREDRRRHPPRPPPRAPPPGTRDPADRGPGARGALLDRRAASTAWTCSTCSPARARSGWRRCRGAPRTADAGRPLAARGGGDPGQRRLRSGLADRVRVVRARLALRARGRARRGADVRVVPLRPAL